MALPEIDLRKIRLHSGSLAKAFEELCCQLASLEPRPAQAVHHRKGAGADAGVECFTRWPDGTETGWQVKFYTAMDASLTRSLDKSIGTALRKHPKLTIYIVCLPFDLSDARTGNAHSPLERWSRWRQKWLDKAAKAGRLLAIDLWNESAIRERLGRDDPLYSGRVLYWFDQEALTPAWFQARFEKARADLGQRYTPETNVQLPVRRVLLAFARDPGLTECIEEWTDKLQEAGHRALSACRDLEGIAGVEPPPHGLESAFDLLASQLAQAPIAAHEPIPVDGWLIAARGALSAARACWRWAWDQIPAEKDRRPSEKADRARHSLIELLDLLERIVEDLEGERWRFANARQMLVYGDGGIGKSHLLADATAYQIERSRPALLLLGSKFVDGDPWRQILDELDLPRDYRVKHILGALDAAAQAAGTRALVTIDALNERHGTEIWPHRLAGLVQDIKPFPRVCLALSCRTTYLDYVIPNAMGDEALPRLEHHGFSSDAARVYLKLRGFTLPGTPYLMPEFSSPLFLRTCCDALEKEGKREFPRGLQGVSAIFDFYKKAVSRAVNERLKLDPRRCIVERAIDALAGAFVGRGTGYVSVDEAFQLLDAILPTGGARDRDLLSQLESEGVLTVEITARGGEPREDVRFTFERFSDHAIAANLLDTHLNKKHPRSSFAAGSALHLVVAGESAYRHVGVIEAIAIQLPERTCIELLDVVRPKTASRWYLEKAFRHSVLWRSQKHFTRRTLELLGKIGGDHLVMSTLISISTEPDNRFNAHHLHSKLFQMPMPKRDAFWSVFVAEEGHDHDGPIETLIDWAFSNGFSTIDADRAELAALGIAWLLTTTNRAVRDRATKSLVALLAPRLALAERMLGHFETVDDGYVLERLLAAIYGAAMQGITDDHTLASVVGTVYQAFFAAGRPPVNALIRDHGRGVIEYALSRGCSLEGIDLAKVRPPYQSPWPIEPVPDRIIESYTEEYKDGERFRDTITISSTNDGDFARYVIDYHVGDWSPAPIGTADLPTDKDVKEAWLAEFERTATPAMRGAYEDLVAADHAGPHWAKSPEFQEAERAFRQAIGEDAWEEYRVRAQNWFGQGMFQFHPAAHRPAHFNLAWARRWICKRAHDLGWSEQLHGRFDKSQPSPLARQGHDVERIGKKYQWLALYELGARIADNLAFIPPNFSDAPQAYEGEWQGSLRNIDPSLLLKQTQDDGWTDWKEPTWWMPIAPNLRPVPAEDRLLWRDRSDDTVNGQELIDVTDPDGRRWLTLYTTALWSQWAVTNGYRGFERQTWGRVSCVVVRNEDEGGLIAALGNRRLTDPHALPKSEFSSGRNYLGEFPWHPAFLEFEGWIPPGESWRAFPVSVRATVAEYTCERGNYDYSIDETVVVHLPAPWLLTSLKLRLSNGRNLTYVDQTGTVRFFDPSVEQKGERAALVDRDAFLSLLDREGLAAVWVIAGEKGVFGGGSDPSRGFGGRLVFTSVYWLEDGIFRQHDHIEHEYPSRDQLKAMLGKNPPKGAKVSR